MGDALEFFGYLFGFWLFIFNRPFRQRLLEEWQARGLIGRLFIPLEVAVSTVCGLAPFALLAWWAGLW